MQTPIPIIDIFAGPGGLGEGFSALEIEKGNSSFKIKLSIEKDEFAHETLELRAFFRQFAERQVPTEYYDYLRGTISREELFDKYKFEALMAKKEAWKAELGKTDPALVKSRIANALCGADNWVLIGGPPCQAYSLAGRSRMIGEDKRKYEADPRHFLYKEYLRILADHQPPVFVMENVKGLLSAKLQQQKTFELILADLRNPSNALGIKSGTPLSYKLFSVSNEHPENSEDIKPENFIVRFEDYGIPQARHRIIIFGIRSDIYQSNPKKLKKVIKQISIEEVIGDLPKLRSGLSKEQDSAEEWRNAIKEINNAKWLNTISLELKHEIISSLKKIGANLNRSKPFAPLTPF